jgi:proton-translocating NADH-quinone oxidoreductase chain M
MMLLISFLLLFFGLLGVLFIKNDNFVALRNYSLFIVGNVLCISTLLLCFFDTNVYSMQHLINFSFVNEINLLNFLFSFGLDSISLFFYYLSTLLILLCILFIWNDKHLKFYLFNLILIEIFLLLIFSVLDLFLFYIFFESILIPMYLVIGYWGSRERKIRASYLFFFYTLCGSIPMLISILYIYNTVGTLNIEYLLAYNFSSAEQIYIWLSFFISFSSKIPMFPFHIWLPEAHVEAPTVGSVLLAGILLKLGVYGFIRFSLTLLPYASFFLVPFVYIFALIGIVYASLSAVRQTDLKRIIAYSSIAHMNLVVLGIFSFNVLGIEGAVLQSVSHGFVSGGMFFLIGILYDRYHTRMLYFYGGLVHMMPIYSLLFLIFTLANIAVPGTSSFVGEFLILNSVFKTNVLISIASSTGVILCGIYSLWLYNRIIFGNLKLKQTLTFVDINSQEFLVIIPLFFFIFFVGIYPFYFLSFLHLSCNNLSFLI